MHHHRDKECESSGENDNPLLSSGMGEGITGTDRLVISRLDWGFLSV